MVSLIDKKADDKNTISNYKPVNVLKIFPKVYEIVLKKELVSASIDLMSPFISACREGYSHHHVFIGIVDECRTF